MIPDNTIYARVVENKIAEYPVFALHIRNRSQPFDWYTQVTFDEMPVAPEFHAVKEHLKLKNGEVSVSYTVEALSLNTILNQLHNPKGPSVEDQVPLAYSDIPQATVDQIVLLTRQQVQKRLDAFAATRNYDSIHTAASYKTSGVANFQAEGQRASDLRDSTWISLYSCIGGVAAGQLPVPKNFTEIESQLPELTWE